MYRQSEETRFANKRAALQRAFIDLTLEKRSMNISVTELAKRAGVNRMTFYSHYDNVSDVLAEFVDGLVIKIMGSDESKETDPQAINIEKLLENATESMHEEIDFYRMIACEEGFEPYRANLRKGFDTIFTSEMTRTTNLKDTKLALVAGMIASAITNAYFDWLAGRFGDLTLDELVSYCENFATCVQENM